jgi:hypothetical protein
MKGRNRKQRLSTGPPEKKKRGRPKRTTPRTTWRAPTPTDVVSPRRVNSKELGQEPTPVLSGQQAYTRTDRAQSVPNDTASWQRSSRRRPDPRPIVGWTRTRRLRNGRVIHASRYGLTAFPIRRGPNASWDYRKSPADNQPKTGQQEAELRLKPEQMELFPPSTVKSVKPSPMRARHRPRRR